MIPVSPKQIRLIATLLRKADMYDSKASAALMYSRNRTESLRKLTCTEADILIRDLIELSPQPDREKVTRMRKKIIAQCREMRWDKDGKTDYERLNNFCLKYGYLHKPMNDYSEKELPRLVSQFEEVYKSYLKKLFN